MKTCNTCHVAKASEGFGVGRNQCKLCRKKRRAKWVSEARSAYAPMKTCSKCHVTKAIECFSGTMNNCRACNNARVMRRYHITKRTVEGWLHKSYSACRERHKEKYEGELITLERFKAIYQAQGGICVETGVPFDLQSKDLMPSPDRIDNDAGYVDGNIRFVTWRINWMRKNLPVGIFQSTCMEVINPNASILTVMPINTTRLERAHNNCRTRHKSTKVS